MRARRMSRGVRVLLGAPALTLLDLGCHGHAVLAHQAIERAIDADHQALDGLVDGWSAAGLTDSGWVREEKAVGLSPTVRTGNIPRAF